VPERMDEGMSRDEELLNINSQKPVVGVKSTERAKELAARFVLLKTQEPEVVLGIACALEEVRRETIEEVLALPRPYTLEAYRQAIRSLFDEAPAPDGKEGG